MILSSTKNLHDGYYYYYHSILLVRKVNVVFLQTGKWTLLYVSYTADYTNTEERSLLEQVRAPPIHLPSPVLSHLKLQSTGTLSNVLMTHPGQPLPLHFWIFPSVRTWLKWQPSLSETLTQHPISCLFAIFKILNFSAFLSLISMVGNTIFILVFPTKFSAICSFGK